MNSFPKTTIKKIAEELICGSNCYAHKETFETIFIFSDIEDIGLDFFDDDLMNDDLRANMEEIKQNKNDYIKIEVLGSRDSYKIMERFASQIPDIKFKNLIYDQLSLDRPFARFKHFVEQSPFKQSWYDFKDQEYQKYVTYHLKSLLEK